MRLRLALLFCLTISLACRAPAVATAGSGRDDFGEVVTPGTPAHPARIVSLNPTTTELLFAIGAGSRLVGRTTWDVWPDSARLVPDLGPGLRPNVEAVLATHPDLVVLYASEDNRAAAAQLQAAKIPVLAMKTDRIEEFRRTTRLLGVATGETARAETVVDTVSRTLSKVARATGWLDKPTVFWHVWDAPIYTIGAGSFLNELVEIAGGRNIYADLRQPSPQVSIEDVVKRDPQYIIAGQQGERTMLASASWRGVRAVREGHIIVMDTNLVGRPSVRLGEAATKLAELLHPELKR